MRSRADSFSSSNSGTVEESPFEEGDAAAVPTSPFARRMSFGARAMRDMRSSTTGNGNANGQGFDFAENMRSRAERSSVSVTSGPASPPIHQRAKSMVTIEPSVQEMPKPKRPDAFQERILKGDFYMD